jgi:transposase
MSNELKRAGRKLRSARKAAQDALVAAQSAALAALAEGATEVEVAKSLGVDRMTVRKWAGKR